MAIKRISELDAVTQEDINALSAAGAISDYFDPAILSIAFVFETSQANAISADDVGNYFVKPTNEANSYYVSKKIDGKTLKDVMTSELDWKFGTKINELSIEVQNLHSIIYNISTAFDNLSALINGWRTGLSVCDIQQISCVSLSSPNISCTNLTCFEDIHGCALSARWN